MDEILDALVAAFDSFRMTHANDAKTARMIAVQQGSLYDRIARSFATVRFGGEVRSAIEATDLIKEVLKSPASILDKAKPQIRETAGRFQISSVAPFLNDDAVERLVHMVDNPPLTRTAEEATMLAYLAAAAIVSEIPSVMQMVSNDEVAPMIYEPRLMQAIARYAAAKSFSTKFHQLASRYDASVSKLDNELTALKAKTTKSLEKLITDTRQATTDLEGEVRAGEQARAEKLKALQTAYDELEVRAGSIATTVEDERAQLTNFGVSIREELRLTRARETWTARYLEAKSAFKWSCMILAGYVVVTGVIAAVIGYWVLPFFARMPVSTDPTIAIPQQLGRAIVISFPIFVFLWTMRAVVRFFMRSMLLMDDARQRETMLDTYFLLTEQGRADERDRPMILWALFKQAPGHGPDGVEPPDFTEVINAGMKRVGG